MDIVSINHLTKEYNSVSALKDISMELVRGKIYGLVGNNGAGKTTLIKCILGLIRPTVGEVQVFGENAYEMSNRSKQNIGLVYDTPMFISNMSAIENLIYFCSPYGISNNKINDLYNEYADKFNLKNSEKKIGEYSMGMKQKLNIIRGLITAPQLLLLDEPFNGLDPSSKIILSKILKDFNRKTKATILISSHDICGLEQLTNDFIYLKNGILELFGDVQNVTNNTPTSDCYKVVIQKHFIKESIMKITSSNKLKVIDRSENSLTVKKVDKSDQTVFEIIVKLNINAEEIKKVNYGLESLFYYEGNKNENIFEKGN